MRLIISSYVACLALPYYSTLCHKRHDFWRMVTEHRISVLIFSTTYTRTIFDLRRIEQRIIINGHRSSLQYTRCSSQILLKLEFSRQIFEK
jgi:hypothetical protein